MQQEYAYTLKDTEELGEGNVIKKYYYTYYKNSYVVYSVELCGGTEYCEVCRENLLD